MCYEKYDRSCYKGGKIAGIAALCDAAGPGCPHCLHIFPLMLHMNTSLIPLKLCVSLSEAGKLDCKLKVPI